MSTKPLGPGQGWEFSERGLLRPIFPEHKPTEREIVSALAGELMTVAIQVSGEYADIGVDVAYNAAGDYLDVIAGTPSEKLIDLPIYLDEDEAAEQIRTLIKRVGELHGEVSQ